jgi:hypothetical protein
VRDTAHTIKEAILGVNVEMSEHTTFQQWKFVTIIAQVLVFGGMLLNHNSIKIRQQTYLDYLATYPPNPLPLQGKG